MAKKVNGVGSPDSMTDDSTSEWSNGAPAPKGPERDITSEAKSSVSSKPRSSNQN